MSEKRPATLSRPCVLIIVMASVERFAYKGVSSNLVTYLADVVGMSTSAAAKSVSTWSGVNFMLPLVSAFLADSYWDRYSTITTSSLLYVLFHQSGILRTPHVFWAMMSHLAGVATSDGTGLPLMIGRAATTSASVRRMRRRTMAKARQAGKSMTIS